MPLRFRKKAYRQLAIPNFAKTMTDVYMADAPVVTAYDADVRNKNIARNNDLFLDMGLTADALIPTKPKKAPAKKAKGPAASRRDAAPRASKTTAAAAVSKPVESKKRGRDPDAQDDAMTTIRMMGSRRLTAVIAGARHDRCMSSPRPCHTASGCACLHLIVTRCVRKLLWAARRLGFPWAFTALSESACMQAWCRDNSSHFRRVGSIRASWHAQA